MTAPLVTVIIPVGPRHAAHCRVAAASALQQTVGAPEVIVIPDGGAEVAPMPGVTVLPANRTRLGPAATRNRGIAAARGRFLLFLDADDYLHPHSLYLLLRAYAEGRAGYVYGDAYTLERDGGLIARRAPDYDQATVARYNLHVVTALVPTEDVRRVGGFDESVDAWEDWTLWLRLAIAGVCGERTPYPVFTYRIYEGDRMTRFYGGDRSLMDAVLVRYQNERGEIPMGCCSGGNRERVRDAEGAVLGAAAPDTVGGDGLVLVEYVGESGSKTPYRPPWEPQTIYLGNNPANRYARVQPRTAEWLAGLGVARPRYTLQSTPPPAPLPEPEAVAAVTGDDVAESYNADAPTEPARARGRKSRKDAE